MMITKTRLKTKTPRISLLADDEPTPRWPMTRRLRRRRRSKVWLGVQHMAVFVVMTLVMVAAVAASEGSVPGVGGLVENGSGIVAVQRGGDSGLEESNWVVRLETVEKEYVPVLASGEFFAIGLDDTAGLAIGEGAKLDRRQIDTDEIDDLYAADSDIARRQSSGWPPRFERTIITQRNGVVRPQNILWGWEFTHRMSVSELLVDPDKSPIQKSKRQDGTTTTDDDVTLSKLPEPKRVRLTFNTCKQPLANKTDYPDGWKAPLAPQLIVYVSNTTENQSPGPNVRGKAQMKVEIDHGWGELEFDASSDIFIGVSAPDLPDSEALTTWQHDPPWNYELAVTTGQPYHGFVNDQFLYLVDTDDTAALMITGNLTSESALYGGVNETLSGEELMKITKFPYTMYAQRINPLNPMPFEGIEKSYCAVRQLAQSKPGQADISMTTRGLGNFPKQQFHLKELKDSSEYLSFLTRPRNVSDSSDTGGTVWAPTAFHTKADGNCKIIYNLPFCAEVAYAVPANPTVFSDTRDLTVFYDDIAERWWKNFTYSLQQVQCNASSSAAYSLVRNCDSCVASYKNWLCAVTIPRCMDYSSKLSYLAPRSENRLFWNATAPGWQERPYTPVVEKDDIPMNVTGPRNRNSLVDEVVMPGRYKEVKPCKDLCWSLVQDCPSSMGFGCPEMGSEGGQESYGERDPSGDVTCSYLGAVYFLNDAWKKGVGVWWWGLLLGAVLWELV